MNPARSKAEAQGQKAKLAHSYHELLEEFSSKDLRNVGNYALGRLIGKGSFGKVYLATHKLTNGSKVVLKSSKKDDSNLAREIHHHRQFLHPHIARLYEVIVTEDLVWLVLEYCPGDELYNYLLRHGALTVAQVQKIFTQLVGAVAYVHNMSCVHRDLKLENILLDKLENVKLCDFGFTREYEGKASYLQTFCGTVCYSAPEMLKGEKYAGEKVDVWSLGVILYALLTGELPFDEDDEGATKLKILSSEPKYPDHLPVEAKALIALLLSKRPLLRPSLSDILAHPFLAEHAAQQQAILKLQQPPPFTTKLEKDTLERMRSAGVDIDKVIESVLARRCDALAGWWALLIEKEARKELRRERKRKEREAEDRNFRRLSAASARLEIMATTLKEVDEGQKSPRLLIGDPPRSRGRRERRSIPNWKVQSDLPRLSEKPGGDSPESSVPPPPIEKDSIRSVSSSRQRPPLPPKASIRRSRQSTLHLVSANPELLSPTALGKRRHPRRHNPFINQLAQLKHWLVDTTKRTKSPNAHRLNASSTVQLPTEKQPSVSHKRDEAKPKSSDARTPPNINTSNTTTPRLSTRDPSKPLPSHLTTGPHHRKRSSLSPSPITPHSSYHRRTSAGLRGRKSTSSSVSSIRTIHHHQHSHSKASSTSSTNSMTSSSVVAKAHTRSPRNSIKVLPATPTATTFPSNIRVVRSTTPSASSSSHAALYNESAHYTSSTLHSPALVFAKRKKTPFKGPMLNVGTASGAGSSAGGTPRREASLSRSASAAGRRSGEIIEEEDEDELEEVEEVDGFSPVSGPGEIVVLGAENAFSPTSGPASSPHRNLSPSSGTSGLATKAPGHTSFATPPREGPFHY
ncbi:MAG: hypothetical protein M1817_004410 [Caeruleum heppii]|nr:MAG: hypothetical protein M1817_004410 [Caeruleum heppii]